MTEAFQPIFDRIRAMYTPHADALVAKCDKPGSYYLDTHEVRAKDGYRVAFGGVQINKNYVSAHLMTVYVRPDMLADTSPDLKKRMQGKSCFNFKKMDEALLTEFQGLVEASVDWIAKGGRMLPPGT